MKEKLERRFLAKLENVNHISENQHYIGYSKLYNRKIFIKVFDDENKFLTGLVSYIFDEKNFSFCECMVFCILCIIMRKIGKQIIRRKKRYREKIPPSIEPRKIKKCKIFVEIKQFSNRPNRDTSEQKHNDRNSCREKNIVYH